MPEKEAGCDCSTAAAPKFVGVSTLQADDKPAVMESS
jgi:hypothetical protein